jgi:hypothetical protein
MTEIRGFAHALRTVFSRAPYRAAFFGIALVLFTLMFSIPMSVIPGNDFAIQARILGLRDYALFFALATLISLIATVEIYLFIQNRSVNRRRILGNVAVGGAGFFLGIFSSVLGAATCAYCVSALLSFLGFGTVFFFIENRVLFTLSSIVLLLLSLYFLTKRLAAECPECRVGG